MLCKYHSDGSLDKLKCRPVFRGDRWVSVHHTPTCASSADVKGLLLLLSLAATLDWDLWAITNITNSSTYVQYTAYVYSVQYTTYHHYDTKILQYISVSLLCTCYLYLYCIRTAVHR